MLEVSILINGKVVVALKVRVEKTGDLEAVILDAIAEARKVVGGPLPPFMIDVK